MRFPLISAAFVLLTAQPAAAGIVAHYRMGQDPEPMRMTVTVNDAGDFRMETNGSTMLVLGDIPYVLRADAEGAYAVRLDDAFVVSMAEFDGEEPLDDPTPTPVTTHSAPEPPRAPVAVDRLGTEVVAGRTGTIWRIRDPASPAPAADSDLVISDDAELAPLGRAFAPQRPGAFDPGDPLAVRHDLLRRGAPLREGRRLLLERVDVHPITDAFTLPGPLLSRAAYVARKRRHPAS